MTKFSTRGVRKYPDADDLPESGEHPYIENGPDPYDAHHGSKFECPECGDVGYLSVPHYCSASREQHPECERDGCTETSLVSRREHVLTGLPLLCSHHFYVAAGQEPDDSEETTYARNPD